MHEPIPLDQRVASLEIEVATLKRQVAATHTEKTDWLDGMTGSMKDFPEFKDVLRTGAEWRKAQDPHAAIYPERHGYLTPHASSTARTSS